MQPLSSSIQRSGERSTIERQHEQSRESYQPTNINVGLAERVISGVLGSACLFAAIRKPSPSAALVAIGGGVLLQRGVTGHCYAYEALGKNTAQSDREAGVAVEHSITIGRSPEELYRAWHDPQHIAAIMGELAQVESQGEGRFRWKIELPVGGPLEWSTRNFEDQPNELIAWRTEPGAPFAHAGTVRFRPAPADRGTVVTLRMSFGQSGSALRGLTGKWLTSLPKHLEESVLRRCKSLCETGEIATLEHNPSARKPALVQRLPRLVQEHLHANS
jgi:uncharacterized membrane protein